MENCIFCKIIQGEIPAKKIYEDDKVIAFLDIHPAVDGHTLVIPKEHYEDFTALSDEMVAHIYQVAKKLGKEIMEKLGSKGLTLSVNYGETQEVKHFHLHLLPDYHLKKQEKTIEEVYEILK